MVLHGIRNGVNIRFCPESIFLYFSSAKVYLLLVRTLQTKSDVRTTTCIVKHYTNM